MTDKQLMELCQKYGKEARKWKNRFVALLPEVYKRKLYKKKFHSIYEFAAKLGGVSNKVVDEVLRLDEKFKEMPKLKAMIAEVGVSKVKIVAASATKETDEFFAEKVKTMTRACLETYVRDVKKIPGDSGGSNAALALEEDQNETSENQNLKTQNKNKSTFRMDLSEDAIFNLKLIKQKLEKEKKEVLCWDEVVNMMAEKLLKEEPKRKYKTRELNSRAISAKKRREQSKQCIAPNCKKPALVIHHPERWAHIKSHENIVSMCKAHHELAHRGHLDEENDFKTLFKPIIDPIKTAIDQKMLKHLNGT